VAQQKLTDWNDWFSQRLNLSEAQPATASSIKAAKRALHVLQEAPDVFRAFQAAFRLWEAGYFPDLPNRPLPDDLFDVLSAGRRGGERTFRPDDLEEVQRFYDSQAQRYAVDAAEQNGAPLDGGP
jgi:hypothetical protein